MPGTWLAASVRPGLLNERRNTGIQIARILGKFKERWVLRELGQLGLPGAVREAKLRGRNFFGKMSTNVQYLRAGRRTLQVSQFFEGDSCRIFQRFR